MCGSRVRGLGGSRVRGLGGAAPTFQRFDRRSGSSTVSVVVPARRPASLPADRQDELRNDPGQHPTRLKPACSQGSRVSLIVRWQFPRGLLLVAAIKAAAGSGGRPRPTSSSTPTGDCSTVPAPWPSGSRSACVGRSSTRSAGPLAIWESRLDLDGPPKDAGMPVAEVVRLNREYWLAVKTAHEGAGGGRRWAFQPDRPSFRFLDHHPC